MEVDGVDGRFLLPALKEQMKGETRGGRKLCENKGELGWSYTGTCRAKTKMNERFEGGMEGGKEGER